MTPEQLRQLQELYEWMQSKKVQQISYPLDEASKNAVSEGVLTDDGAGTATLTQSIALSGNAQNINVPAAYLGTERVIINGVIREIPYIT